MDSESLQEFKTLEYEITKGMEQVKQLRASSSRNQERVLDRMLASYEEALLILNESASEGQGQSTISSSSATPDSLMSVGKVKCEDSSEVSKHNQKRKLSSWTKVLRASSLDASQELLDDGYSWRKYGQKDILGSKYPRGYYRCTYRNEQSCLATKQVQRSDDDPSVFEITYRGRHTCKPLPSAGMSMGGESPGPGPGLGLSLNFAGENI